MSTYIKKQKDRELVQITNKETIKDLRDIQDILVSETGLDLSLQNVVNHLIKEYLKER
tara:strand:+ start:7531 stop:7704 length:174 start_codon:yes stop_codon:yes gene_type:complete